MAECIHGFEGTLCDSCFPKTPIVKPRAVASTRTASAPRRGAGASAHKTLNTRDMRVYHLTHVRNLPAIIAAGELRADARPEVDLSSELARELRATAEVAPGSTVADHVAFLLAPDADVWSELRRGAAETRWSDAARRASSTDFVFLVTTVGALGEGVVVADGDAASTYTRFAMGEDSSRMLTRLHGDDSGRAAAEVLAPSTVDFTAIQLVGVANEPARDAVRAALSHSGFSTKVAVYPPWFQGE